MTEYHTLRITRDSTEVDYLLLRQRVIPELITAITHTVSELKELKQLSAKYELDTSAQLRHELTLRRSSLRLGMMRTAKCWTTTSRSGTEN